MTNTRFISKLLFWVAILTAISLRLWGINAGLPDIKIHIDENAMVNIALGIVPLKGALWTSGNGFLIPYLLLTIYIGYFLIGHLFGQFPSSQSFLTEYLKNPGSFILIGRELNTLFAILTVYLTFMIYRRWFNDKIALISTWFLAVSFIHVKESHYIKNDIGMGLIVLGLYHYACLITKEGKLRHYIIAAVLAGFAFGIKIFPVLAAILILGAHFIRVKSRQADFLDPKIILAVLIFCLTIFIQVAPTLIFLPGGVAEFFRIGSIIHDIGLTTSTPVAFIYIFEHLRGGIGSLMLLVSAIGAAVAIKNIKQPTFFLAILFPAFFLLTVEFWAKYSNPRHSIILLPAFILLAGIGVEFIVKHITPPRIRQIALVLLTIFVMAPTLIRSIKIDRYFDARDTRQQAKAWVEKNIPSGSNIVVEGTLKPYISGGAVSLALSHEALELEIEDAYQKNQPGAQVKTLALIPEASPSYSILATPRIDKRYDTISGQEYQLADSSLYINKGYNVVATLSWQHVPELSPDFWSDFNLNYQKAAEFRPTINFSVNPHDTTIEYRLIDQINPFSDNLISGPTIEIYRRKVVTKL